MLPVSIFRTAVAVAFLAGTFSAAASEPTSVSFRRDLAPVLRDHCLACHCERKSEGGYRVDSYEQLMKPGESEEAPVVAGKPEESELLRRLKSEDESERMPLESPALPPSVVAQFEQWIRAGAAYDGESPGEAIVTIVPPPTYPEPPLAYRAAVPVTALAVFEEDGKQRLASSGYGELLIWNLDDGSLLRRIPGLPPRIHAIAVHGQAKQFAVAGGEPGRAGDVRIVGWNDGQVAPTSLVRGDVILSVDHTRIQDRLAAASSDGSVSVMAGAKIVWTRLVHKDWATCVRFSADGKMLASGGLDQQVKLLDADRGEEITVFAGHKFPIWAVAFAADGQSVFSGDEGGRILQWSTSDGKQLAELRASGAVYQLAIDGPKLYAAAAGNRVTEFDTASKKALRHFAGLGGRAISLVVMPAEKQLVAGTDTGDVVVFSLETGKAVRKWKNAPPTTKE